jgi:xylitol oxidase
MTPTTPQLNWAGNVIYSAARLHQPETIEQLQEVVRGSRKLRVLGSRHSFNTIADCAEDLVSLDKLPQSARFDRERGTVTVNGGITYGQLCPQLHRAGYALHNMASLPHISVAGAIATATHGSGDANGNLATAVEALKLVAADGDVMTLSREQHGEQFDGAVVGLGGLGVVTEVTLAVQPAFSVQQEVYEDLPVEQLEDHFDDIVASAYSVSLFHDWRSEAVSETWLKRRLPDRAALPVAPDFFGAKLAPTDRHPVVRLSADPCTVQMGIPGPWHERLPHFRVDHVPASGDELQSEYFVPRHHALAAVRAVERLGERMAPLLWISEVRTIAADALWMSPCYGQACVGLHFSWRRDWPAVQKLLPLIEEALAPFEPRPHWGKLFTMPASQVQSRYPRLPDFRALLGRFDPGRRFRNAFLDAYIFG